jgi:hypothetical protein
VIPVSATALLLGAGPRFVRDTGGPVLAFYAGWKLHGLVAGIAAASAISALGYAWERRHARSGTAAGLGLAIAAIQAVVGLASGSEAAYFAPPVVANAVYGLAFLGSVAVGRPLAAVFAREAYPFPDEVRRSPAFVRVFARISLAWAACLIVRSALRLAVLTQASVDTYVVVNLLTGGPVTMTLFGWSIWYAMRSLSRPKAGAAAPAADLPVS